MLQPPVDALFRNLVGRMEDVNCDVGADLDNVTGISDISVWEGKHVNVAVTAEQLGVG